jgi:hypothetical protein
VVSAAQSKVPIRGVDALASFGPVVLKLDDAFNPLRPPCRRDKSDEQHEARVRQGLGDAERSAPTITPPHTPSTITARTQKTKLATKAPQKAKNPTPKAFVTRTGIGAGFT